MRRFIPMYHELAHNMGEVALDQGEWVLMMSDTGTFGVFHRHDDRYGGGRNGPPYIAACSRFSCRDCPSIIPTEMQGFLELANWER